jgi:beta-glucosidase
MIRSILLFTFIMTPLSSQASPVYLNTIVPPSQRVEDLLNRMTLEEKIGQMCQYVGIKQKRDNRYETIEEIRNSDNASFYTDLSVDDISTLIRQGRIGSFLHVVDIDEANFLQQQARKSRLRIPLLMGIDASHGHGMVRGTTVFPTLIGLASTWNQKLVQDIGRITAREMRATGYHWTFSVNLSIARDARWGRVGETFGEDPFLIGQLGAAITRGYQGNGFSNSENVISCANYFIASSTPLNGTNFAPIEVSLRSLREVYLPPYQACINAGVYTVMAAHNDLNGLPCHANRFLLTDLLRRELGFKGFVVSDWMDIERLYTLHHLVDSQKEACKLAVLAGADMNMHGPGFFEHILELVKEGEISEQRINESVRKILYAKFQLGLFEKHITDPKGKKQLRTREHQHKVLEAARQSIILLKNEKILPLSESVRSVFITGPNSDNETILGDWTLEQPDENVITILEGIRQIGRNKGVKVTFFDCGRNIKNLDKNRLREAGKKAKDHDVAIVVVGENSLRYPGNQRTCGENADRDRIDLAGNQLQLVQNVAQSGAPTVVVLINGRPLALPWVYKHIPAVIETWEPGMLGGLAVAEILFGKINPCGKLPITIPRSAGQVQSFYNHKPSHYYRKYIVGDTGPFYPFGFGLSYSSFEYTNLRISNTVGEKTSVSVDVRNTGSLKGTEIVQLYIHDRTASVTRPVKELKGFKRVTLKAGENTSVRFDISTEHLSFINDKLKRVAEPGFFDIMVGPNSDDLNTITFEYKK